MCWSPAVRASGDGERRLSILPAGTADPVQAFSSQWWQGQLTEETFKAIAECELLGQRPLASASTTGRIRIEDWPLIPLPDVFAKNILTVLCRVK
jgi:hypothetical protein